MRVGEVLNLTARYVEDQKLTIKNPKSGKPAEAVFIPKKVADRSDQMLPPDKHFLNLSVVLGSIQSGTTTLVLDLFPEYQH
jgi:hypothetical protein